MEEHQTHVQIEGAEIDDAIRPQRLQLPQDRVDVVVLGGMELRLFQLALRWHPSREPTGIGYFTSMLNWSPAGSVSTISRKKGSSCFSPSKPVGAGRGMLLR